LICIAKENCEINEPDEEKKAFEDVKTKFEPICKKIKDTLGKDCKKVVVSKRLVITRCVIVMGE